MRCTIMQELYRADGLDDKKVEEILQTITLVESDNDWDGISSAAQVKFHFPEVKVNLTGHKVVDSDSKTLVLDKKTTGSGWIIDHHTTSKHDKAKLLCYSTSGELPTSRLTYLALNKKLDGDLFLSATAEVTDELYRKGLESGSLGELKVRAPYYFKQSAISNQYLKDGEIYSIADILDIVSSYGVEYAFELALSFYKKAPKSSAELIEMLDSRNKELIEGYRAFIRDFDFSYFETMEIAGKEVFIIESEKIGKFFVPLLGIARRKKFGNYILFKGLRASLRTSDSALADAVFKKLESVLKDHGGRAGSYGMLFKEEVSYEHFKKLLNSK